MTILRGTLSTGLQRQLVDFADVATVWAQKTDVSDGERIRAGQFGAELTARFKVRRTSVTLEITTSDRLRCSGREYDILGIKESDPLDFLELTARARADAALAETWG